MKFALFFLVVVAVTVSAGPVKKKEGPACKSCDNDPKGQVEDIVCAEGNGHKFSFFNECVLKKVNCENNRDMKVVGKGLCPGQSAASIRLS